MKADVLFAARMALRDYRAGELRILLIALLLFLSGCHSPDPYQPYVEKPTPPSGSGSARA